MSVFRADGLDRYVARKSYVAWSKSVESVIVPLFVAIFLVAYFCLCGYVIIHGSTALSSLDNSEATTSYGQ